ncbi:MAG: hypothetical protein LBT50_06780, partial [Prevotellaceae bacterium]|nr:hypothetical protein [Prevotellaceae bacterium]
MKQKIFNTAKGFLVSVFTVLCVSLNAQTGWPLSMVYENMKIQIFKPEIESFNTDKLSFRAALMLVEDDNNVFGSIWADANLQINKTDRTVTIIKAVVNDLRFPDGYSADKESGLIKLIERNLYRVSIRMDDILSDLENNQNEQSMARSMNNAPPVIHYTTTPSILVTIDGDPILQPTDTKDVEMITNSPFLILKYKNIFYLSNGALWYESKSPLSGWMPKSIVPTTVDQVAKALKSDSDNIMEENSFYPEVIVSTIAAELIQTDGAPTFAAIPNTMMLYISNTSDQIVMDIKSQQYFVLLSGRWYASPKLDGNWKYIDFNDLPADFAKIPEGSNKDVLLASVPETKAAQDAVRESLVPQAAIIDRSTANTQIVYDGDPYFENIEGTTMRYAANSSGTVLYENNTYYVVDNGVWFSGSNPRGPWIVSDRRPVQINIIPPSCPVYNVRYVYVYHSTPQVVYVGYTKGYLSSYRAGNVIVYGTGHRYRPWRGHCYYPRPCTWGYGMAYNPWNGWSVNFVYSSGWFGYSYPHTCYSYYPYYNYRPDYRYRSGWWGPPVYRPPYCVPYTHYYGNYHAQVRPSNRYNIYENNLRVSSPSRNSNIYAYNSGRGGVQSTRSSIRSSSSSNNRQNLTKSYSAQARPTATSSRSSGSSAPSTRPSGNETRNNSSGTSTRSSGSTSSSTPSRGSSVTTRPSTSTGTRNPASSSTTTTTPSRSNSSTTTTTPSRSNSSTTTTTPSRSNSSTTTTPSRSNSSTTTPTTTTPSRSPSSSSSTTTTTPSRSPSSSSSSTTTTPSKSPSSSSSTTTTTPSRSPSSSSSTTTTTPSRSPSSSSSSSSTTTTPSRSSGSSSSS